MGQRITQRIYVCSDCGETPNDGEYMWRMDRGRVVCENCIDKDDVDKEVTEKTPEVMQQIYVESTESNDTIGGIATVSRVNTSIDSTNVFVFVEVFEHPNQIYIWNDLQEKQEDLKRIFGNKRAYYNQVRV